MAWCGADMMNNHRPHARFFVTDGWTCAQCDHNNSRAVTLCQGLACVDLREDDERMRIQRRLATAHYMTANGITAPPAKQHGDWHDFLSEGDDR